MIGWALFFELNFCIILYDTVLCYIFFHNNGGGRRGCHKLTQFGTMNSIYFTEYFLFEDFVFLEWG